MAFCLFPSLSLDVSSFLHSFSLACTMTVSRLDWDDCRWTVRIGNSISSHSSSVISEVRKMGWKERRRAEKDPGHSWQTRSSPLPRAAEVAGRTTRSTRLHHHPRTSDPSVESWIQTRSSEPVTSSSKSSGRLWNSSQDSWRRP